MENIVTALQQGFTGIIESLLELCEVDDMLDRDTRHADNAQLVVGIKLLNQMHWYRDKGKKESAKTFKKKAKVFLLANFDNQNIK